MKLRGSSYLYPVIMAIALAVIGLALPMKYPESKLLPLLISSLVFVLSGIGLWKGISARGVSGANIGKGEITVQEAARESWGGYLIVGAWVMGFSLTIYVLGFLVAIPLFVFTYMRSHGTRWYVAIIYAVVATAFMYGIFERLLGVTLYRGLIPSWFG
ncbi:MAG: tripartite tricarboxylate transporter TctB family protein [Chloroflexi bacterium]|nr:tripartite tricarboxylate transporter TctB family protein [Chloroflexota bacterium]